MDASSSLQVARESKEDEETLKRVKRHELKALNTTLHLAPSKASLDSSLKRHTALIKRAKQSIGLEHRDQLLKDIDGLTLERYLDEIATAVIEGVARCKNDKDVWSATEIISALHRRLNPAFSPKIVPLLHQGLSPPPRVAPGSAPPVPAEAQERETAARIARQRPLLRVCAELAMVGIIGDGSPGRSGGEWIMKSIKELLSHDPSLSSLPLLTTFLRSYSRPYLGISPTAVTGQVTAANGDGSISADAQQQATSANVVVNEDEELIAKDIRDRFKKMCEGYFDNVSKILVKDHLRLQEQERRNHEAYIRSGEIFEDRQQAYEKMTKGYEKLLTSCQTLSELLQVPMPHLPMNTAKGDTIGLSSGNANRGLGADEDIYLGRGSQWEDEEERKFYEDLTDLKGLLPKSVCSNTENASASAPGDTGGTGDGEADESEETHLERLGDVDDAEEEVVEEDVKSSAGAEQTQETEVVAPGPSLVLSEILGRLSDATNCTLIDQAAIDFAYVNSKAARKRLIKFLLTSPLKRTDLLPYYGRLVATISQYSPDLGKDLIAELESEFRYLNRKKKVVKELAASRNKNIGYFTVLTKFKLVPQHVILHIIKVFLDDLSGVNVDNLATLLEGCGRFLLRGEDTTEKMSSMLEVMKRKQSAQHFDQRQLLLLENAYYQCNPPERDPVQHKERSVMEQFIRHLLCDVLTRRTVDKVLKLLRKLRWDDAEIYRVLFRLFSRPWKVAYGSVTLLAMLTYDLQRYHPEFAVAVVDQVLENIRRGMELNIYRENQKRVATVKYLGELYIYRMINSRVVFDTLWSLVTFGHHEGRPLPGVVCPMDAPDDFFRIRLVCTLLDACGMCFDRGSHKRKLNRFLVFFQLYILTKSDLPMDVDFMISETMETLRPKLVFVKSFEEAAIAVDEMFEAIRPDAEDSGEDSGDDDEREQQEEEDGMDGSEPVDERVESPVVLLNAHENLGPSEEELAEFDREFSKLMSEAAADAKRVDRRAAQSVWDSTALPGSGVGKRRKDDQSEPKNEEDKNIMKFTVLSKRGVRNSNRELAVPISSALAAHTRTAQLQNEQEQELLKRLVLNYGEREEENEIRSLQANLKAQGFRVRYNG